MLKKADPWRVTNSTTRRNVSSSWFDNSATVFAPLSLPPMNWSETGFLTEILPSSDDRPHPWTTLDRITPAPLPEKTTRLVDDPIQEANPDPEPEPEPEPPAMDLPAITEEKVEDEIEAKVEEKLPAVIAPEDLSPVMNTASRPAARQRVYADLVKRAFGTDQPWLLGEETFPALPAPEINTLDEPTPDLPEEITLEPDPIPEETAPILQEPVVDQEPISTEPPQEERPAPIRINPFIINEEIGTPEPLEPPPLETPTIEEPIPMDFSPLADEILPESLPLEEAVVTKSVESPMPQEETAVQIYQSIPVENLLPGVINMLADAVEVILHPVWSVAAPDPTPMKETAQMTNRMGALVRASARNVVTGVGDIVIGTLTIVTGLAGCITRVTPCVARPSTNPGSIKITTH
ncbi:MAG: hypothetical protein HQL93_01925 [Magnetococcales bacterium]|nr:hypothetical protein [Magnetococcales bacterium]